MKAKHIPVPPLKVRGNMYGENKPVRRLESESNLKDGHEKLSGPLTDEMCSEPEMMSNEGLNEMDKKSPEDYSSYKDNGRGKSAKASPSGVR